MFYKSLIIFLFCFTNQTISEILNIIHYENVTQTSCGLNLLPNRPVISRHSCFKWHKTILEQTNQLKSIMNGRDAVEGEFPYTVYIYMSGKIYKNYCTGSLLNDMWIITVAHCFIGWSAEELKIYPGITHYSESYNGYYKADKIIPYHKNDQNKSPAKTYDLALIKLKTKIDFSHNNKVNSVCLPNRDYNVLSSLATLTGWGYLNQDEINKYTLRMTPIIVNEFNDGFPHQIKSRNFKYGKGCKGDSGAPLVQYVNNLAVLIGVYIGAGPMDDHENCGKRIAFMTFSYIPFYVDWIETKIIAY